MPSNGRMNINERRKYLKLVRSRYVQSGRKERSQLLTEMGQDTLKLTRRKPQPPNRLLRYVPIERLSWQTTAPGNFETDLAHHCGAVAAGDYIPRLIISI